MTARQASRIYVAVMVAQVAFIGVLLPLIALFMSATKLLFPMPSPERPARRPVEGRR